MPIIDTISAHLAPAMLVIFRIGGLAVFAPLLASSVVPVRIRVLLTIVLGLAAYPLLSTRAGFADGVVLDLWTLAPLALAEITLGALVGYLASIPLVTAQTAGLVMGQQMGLGFARLFNPAMDDEADVVGQALFLLAIGGFLAVGGHEQMLLCLMHSFEHVPLGAYATDIGVLELIAGVLIASLEMALRIAAPLLAMIFLETIAMGFLAKTVPQLNILSLGFPVRIMAGLFIIASGLLIIDAVLIDGVNDAFAQILSWLHETGVSRG